MKKFEVVRDDRLGEVGLKVGDVIEAYTRDEVNERENAEVYQSEHEGVYFFPVPKEFIPVEIVMISEIFDKPLPYAEINESTIIDFKEVE